MGIRKLRNGAVVLAEFKKDDDAHVVLCDWNDKLVTWKLDEEDNAYFGHYFEPALMYDAMADFVRRSVGIFPERIVCDNLPALGVRQAD